MNSAQLQLALLQLQLPNISTYKKGEKREWEMRNKTIGIIITKRLANKITEQSKRNQKIGKSKSSESISNLKINQPQKVERRIAKFEKRI